MEATSEKAFHAYGTKMRAVTEFKYLGRVLTNTDDDWPAVAGNIRKARASWGRLARVLGREEDLLCHGSIETVCHFQVRPLLSQNPRQPSSARPRLPDVSGHRWPVIICVCKDPP